MAVLATALVGCGSDGTSPFDAPKGESQAAASLGIPVVATRNTTRTATNDPVAAAAAVARAAFPGGSADGRASAVALVDRADWRSALAATALVAPPIGAPLLFGDGTDVPAASSQALAALAPAGSSAVGGAQVIRIGNVGRPAGERTTDIGGANPYEIAGAIDRFTTTARGHDATRVLVVSGDQPDFAVPAAAWLAKSGDPVAFVSRESIPPATLRQLRTHRRATFYVLGPTAVIASKVTKQLRTLGTVKRVGGVTPVSNAIGLAQYRDGSFGWNVSRLGRPGHGFTIARTTDTLGAISLAPLSTSGLHGPLLLLDSATRLSPEVDTYLHSIQPGYEPDDPALDASQAGGYNRAWLTGDVDAISAGVQAQIDDRLEIAPVSTTPSTTTSETTPAPTTPTTTGTTPTPAP